MRLSLLLAMVQILSSSFLCEKINFPQLAKANTNETLKGLEEFFSDLEKFQSKRKYNKSQHKSKKSIVYDLLKNNPMTIKHALDAIVEHPEERKDLTFIREFFHLDDHNSINDFFNFDFKQFDSEYGDNFLERYPFKPESKLLINYLTRPHPNMTNGKFSSSLRIAKKGANRIPRVEFFKTSEDVYGNPIYLYSNHLSPDQQRRKQQIKELDELLFSTAQKLKLLQEHQNAILNIQTATSESSLSCDKDITTKDTILESILEHLKPCTPQPITYFPLKAVLLMPTPVILAEPVKWDSGKESTTEDSDIDDEDESSSTTEDTTECTSTAFAESTSTITECSSTTTTECPTTTTECPTTTTECSKETTKSTTPTTTTKCTTPTATTKCTTSTTTNKCKTPTTTKCTTPTTTKCTTPTTTQDATPSITTKCTTPTTTGTTKCTTPTSTTETTKCTTPTSITECPSMTTPTNRTFPEANFKMPDNNPTPENAPFTYFFEVCQTAIPTMNDIDLFNQIPEDNQNLDCPSFLQEQAWDSSNQDQEASINDVKADEGGAENVEAVNAIQAEDSQVSISSNTENVCAKYNDLVNNMGELFNKLIQSSVCGSTDTPMVTSNDAAEQIRLVLLSNKIKNILSTIPPIDEDPKSAKKESVLQYSRAAEKLSKLFITSPVLQSSAHPYNPACTTIAKCSTDKCKLKITTTCPNLPTKRIPNDEIPFDHAEDEEASAIRPQKKFVQRQQPYNNKFEKDKSDYFLENLSGKGLKRTQPFNPLLCFLLHLIFMAGYL